MVAVPSAVAKFTVTVREIGVDNDTVKAALRVPELPSTTPASDTLTVGLSSSGIVPVAVGLAIVVPIVVPVRSTKNCSVDSWTESLMIGTTIVVVVWLARNVAVLLVAPV